jgi:hypothetical protein
MKAIAGSRRHRWVAGLSVFLVTAVLVTGMVGCVTAEYDVTAPSTEGSEVTSPGEETFTYVEVTFPDPNFGATLTGPVSNETGSIFPADLQRHSFFSGAT